MRWRHKTEQLEFQALAMTPSGGADLAGHWRAWQETENGEVLSGVQLEQYGTAVYGLMQCKLAIGHPLQIRGLVIDDKLIANYWRPHNVGMGSGIIDLSIEPGGQRLVGSASWHNAHGSSSEVFRWERSAT